MKLFWILLNALVLVIISSSSITAQSNSCLEKHQLLKAQSSSLGDIREFMSSISWEFDGAKTSELFSYFSYSLEYDLVKWTNSYSYQNSRFYLYSYPLKPNIVIYQTNFDCFKTLINQFEKHGKASSRVEQDMLVTSFKDNDITTEFREYKNDYSHRQYSILVYNKSRLDSEIEALVERDRLIQEEQNRIDQIKSNTIREASASAREGRYEDAIKFYENGNQLLGSNYFQSDIQSERQKLIKSKIESGDSNLQRGDYAQALAAYNKALEYDPNNNQIKEKISTTKSKELNSKVGLKTSSLAQAIEENNLERSSALVKELEALGANSNQYFELKKKYLEVSKLVNEKDYTIHSYKKLKPADFSSYLKSLEDILNSEINLNSTGSMSFDHTISFDLTASYQSIISSSAFSSDQIERSVVSQIESIPVSAPFIWGYSLQAQEKTSVRVSWESRKIVFIQKRKTSYIIGDNYPDKRYFLNYVDKYQRMPGKYTFEVKSKQYNGKTYNDVYAVNYSTRGPSNALYSMVLPGVGSARVSYGKKGWGRMVTFLLCSALSYSTYLYSQDQYRLYEKATTPAEIEEYYNNANSANQSAILLGGTAATIYIYDVFWTIIKGAKNKQQSRRINRDLKINKERINYEPIRL